MKRRRLAQLLLLSCSPALFSCASMKSSQKMVRQQVEEIDGLRLIRQTALYNLYYDEHIKRSILHSSYFRSGTEAASAGIGIDSFDCNPDEMPPIKNDR